MWWGRGIALKYRLIQWIRRSRFHFLIERLFLFSFSVDMVCGDEGSVQCIISNLMPGATKKKITLMVRPSNTVPQLFSDIKTQLDVDNFEIVMQTTKDGEEVCVSEMPVTPFLAPTNEIINIHFSLSISDGDHGARTEDIVRSGHWLHIVKAHNIEIGPTIVEQFDTTTFGPGEYQRSRFDRHKSTGRWWIGSGRLSQSRGSEQFADTVATVQRRGHIDQPQRNNKPVSM